MYLENIAAKGDYFNKYAQQGSDKLMRELQEKYQPKGENKVNIGGLTISFDKIKLTKDGLEIAISSKVPTKEEFSYQGKDEQDYATAFSEALDIFPNKPVLVAYREQTTRDESGNILKERGYIDVIYCLEEDRLYPSNEKLMAEAMDIKYEYLDKGKSLPEDIPKEISPTGNLVLKNVRDCMYKHRQDQVDYLRKADKFARISIKTGINPKEMVSRIKSLGIVPYQLYSLDDLVKLSGKTKYHIRKTLSMNKISRYEKEGERRRYTLGVDLILVEQLLKKKSEQKIY